MPNRDWIDHVRFCMKIFSFLFGKGFGGPFYICWHWKVHIMDGRDVSWVLDHWNRTPDDWGSFIHRIRTSWSYPCASLICGRPEKATGRREAHCQSCRLPHLKPHQRRALVSAPPLASFSSTIASVLAWFCGYRQNHPLQPWCLCCANLSNWYAWRQLV